MQPVSAGFLAAVAGSHTVSITASLMAGGVVVAEDLRLLGGSVTVDRTAQVRRQCRSALVDPAGALLPTGASDPLSPYGNEVQLHRGVLVDGVPERVSLGIFRISNASVEDVGVAGISFTGYDRSRAISRNRLTDEYVIAAGQSYATVIAALLEDRLPGLDTSLVAGSLATQVCPALVLQPQIDPWVEAGKMARALGMELFFGVDGRPVMQPEPEAAADAVVAEYVAGPASVLTRLTKSFDDNPGINGVIVYGEATSGPPVRGEAWDSNPTSPTYYLGPYGRVPEFEVTSYAATAEQASAWAAASLLRRAGGTEALSFEIIPNPALEAGDSVRVARAPAGVDEIALVESFTVPLESTAGMTVIAKSRRTVT